MNFKRLYIGNILEKISFKSYEEHRRISYLTTEQKVSAVRA